MKYISLSILLLLLGYSCTKPDKIIVCKYLKKQESLKVSQFLILSDDQEYIKVLNVGDKTISDEIAGKYSSEANDDYNYEIVLYSDNKASYEVFTEHLSMREIDAVAVVIGREKNKTIEKLHGKWKQVKDGTIEIRLSK